MIKFFKDESGATAIEYGLIATTMGMALIAVMPTLVSAISDRFTILASDLAGGS
ncbi:MAG: Flp family type IVb pilin [Proteobacteria bacterium]|nr:Flp family type IVb pilin [Pseudomonadota bacterium]